MLEKIIFKNQEQFAPRGYGLYDLTTLYQSRVLNKTKSCLKLVFLSVQSSSCFCRAVNTVRLFAGPVGWEIFLFQLPLTFLTTRDEGCFLCPILYSMWYYQDLFIYLLLHWVCDGLCDTVDCKPKCPWGDNKIFLVYSCIFLFLVSSIFIQNRKSMHYVVFLKFTGCCVHFIS